MSSTENSEQRYTAAQADECRARITEIVESFPEASAAPTVGVHLKLSVREKGFGWFMEDHHGDGRLAINCKAYPGVQLSLVEKNPTIFHIPKYVGHKGWAGVWVDDPALDWQELRGLLLDAYTLTAPKSLLRTM